MTNVRRREVAYGYNTSGHVPDKKGFGAEYYLRLALKSSHTRERERRLIKSLLNDIRRFNSPAPVSEGVKANNSSTTLFDFLIENNEELFIDFIESVIFSEQATYEAWQSEGYIDEDKREGAKSLFRLLKENSDVMRLVVTMKNKRGSGVVFKDIITGKTLLPNRWGKVKGLPVGRLMIVKVNSDNKVTKVFRGH